MRKITIPKKSGGARTIYVPSEAEMQSYRALLPRLATAQAAQCDPAVVHGFAAHRSAVTNALAHAGRRYTLCMDLADFFDSVRPSMLAGRCAADLIAACMIDGAPRQGLPTSPAVANIAASAMDRAIARASRKSGHAIVYTRYADDLAISSDELAGIEWARKSLPEIVGRCGFTINASKTRVQDQRYQRRIITGVALTDDGRAVPTRRTRRAARAAWRRAELEPGSRWARVAAGLTEWSRMRTPRPPQPATAPARVDSRLLARLCDRWGLRRIGGTPPPKSEEPLREDVIVTGDPAYLLGPSQWGTSWTSCMRHHQSGYQFHRGAALWLALRGTRIAALLSPHLRTDVVTRRQMRARCLVHELRDGRRCYDRLYGESGAAMQELSEALQAAGYVAAARCSRALIVGHVPCTWVRTLPALDHTRVERATASAGMHRGSAVYTVRIA